MPNPRIIAPSVLACDFGRLADDLARVEQAGADWHHADVMDGAFVPNISFGVPVVAAVARVASIPVDVHLMIARPSQYLAAFADAGASRISFHIETIGTTDPEPIDSLFQTLRDRDVKVGLALSPDTPVDRILPFLGQIDMALVMTVHPGFGGQKLIPETLDTVRAIREEADTRNLPRLRVQVDGGIDAATIDGAVEAGADVIVAGSYVFHAPNRVYADRIEQLRAARAPA